MPKVVVQNNKRQDFVKLPVTKKQESKNLVIEKNKRKKSESLPSLPAPTLISKIKTYISDNNSEYYLGFGGTGDALLLLASCYNNPKARVVFFSNNLYFMGKFFDLFKTSVFLHENIMGHQFAGTIFNMISTHTQFKQSAHLADGLYYGDWANITKYESRIVPFVPWIEVIGKIKSEQPIFVLAPSGSVKETKRQRYLTVQEYNRLIELNTRFGYKIYCFGSVSDLHYYGFNPNTIWITVDKMYISENESRNINLHQMLQIINTASKVISMDTWLKTYTLLCGIPTVVVRTRWNGKYINYGQDITDFIFLNKNIFPGITLLTIEELLTN
jgi:hypothetical protein